MSSQPNQPRSPFHSPLTPNFPPIRACIFDLDGLLINTEDLLTSCVNGLLATHGRPPMTRAIRVQILGVPDSTAGDAFHEWAQLPIPREQWVTEESAMYENACRECGGMRGAEALLEKLSGKGKGGRVEVALGSSSARWTFEVKMQSPRVRRLVECIPERCRVIGDAEGVGRGKPAPDVFLVALGRVNEVDGDGEGDGKEILPNECLVFEDSVVGVQAARRAGMRVVWVPSKDVREEYEELGMVGEVLAGRVGTGNGEEEIEGLGQVGDGWGEMVGSLEEVDLEKYGIAVR
ncbi:HAD-like protein [Lophiostoma macrostomum CBS 122681]|uniref:HAD-like protein n=1 Tax=Lophiostoma macrostomum CBS 122681 TaxID=1314788 RepID=A0A6A6T0T4_9PLEO|nr:HAD-like protein [Lophiostoma macrostomum CBS 122681]